MTNSFAPQVWLHILALVMNNTKYIPSDPDHYKLAAKMFEIAYKNGDIYKAQYEGWYDTRNEKFLTETQAKETNYIDPESKQKYTKHSEETYFFKMSKYQQRLLDHIKQNRSFIEPEKSYQFILRRLTDDKLSDLCVSRSTFDWGIPVPIDDKHIIYVWFDALSNYLTGIKYFDDAEMAKFWPANVHIIGKDIVWFHCVIWPCILMSCQIALPRKVFCHGFVMDKEGKKMSKSIGNVVDPFDTLKKYKCDSLRYFIISQATFGNDMRWNDDDLEKRHDAHLAHIYGNLVYRALKLCKKNCNGKVPDGEVYADIFDLKQLVADTEDAFREYDLSKGAELAMDALRKCNDWITKKEPWKLPKDQRKEKKKIIKSILECIYILAHFMEPYTPNSSQQIFNDLNHSRVSIKKLNANFKNLREGTKVKQGQVLFAQHSSKFERKIENENKPIIARIDFKIGQIIDIKQHDKDERLYVESIDCGEHQPRTVVSGLAKHYPDKTELLNQKVIVFANLKYSKFKGVESQGMVMCSTDASSGQVKILRPPKDAKVGSSLKWKNSADYKADDKINIGKKNSFWKKEIVEKLVTDKDGNMAFNGVAFKTADDQFVASDFSSAQIS